MENIINIHLTLVHKDSTQPLVGDEFSVRLYDQDIISDDFLGENSLDANGHAMFPIVESDFNSADSPNEWYPDLYFIVLKDGTEIFKSVVFKDQEIDESDPFPASEGLHFNLGTFLI